MSIELGNDLSKKLEHCKTICLSINTLIVPAGIRGLLDSAHLDLEETSFFSLVTHEKPSAVFYETVVYEPDRFIRSTMLAHGWEEDWEHDQESIWPTPEEIKTKLQVELKQVENQIGLPRSLMMIYAIDGLNRLCWLSAEWAEYLSERIEAILDERHERAEEAILQIATTLDSLINEVANDPEFRAIRGRPKKLLFLQKKYGERIPPHPREKIARPAQNCDYVDENIAIVLIKADELVWAAENIK